MGGVTLVLAVWKVELYISWRMSRASETLLGLTKETYLDIVCETHFSSTARKGTKNYFGGNRALCFC